MNKLPDELLIEIFGKRRGQTRQNVRNLAVVSSTSKRFRNVLGPYMRQLRGVRNMYVALPRNRLGMIVPMSPADMRRVQGLVQYPFMLREGNRPRINYEQRKNVLESLKKTPKQNVVRHEGGVTFRVPANGTSYTLRTNGNLVSHRGMRNRVLYKNVKKNNLGL